MIVWQRAMDLVAAIYKLTRLFPSDERFGLTNQIRRAAVSVPSNIAEGQGRRSDKDFVRYLKIANSSRQEVETQIYLAKELGFVSDDEVSPVLSTIEEVGRLIFGLVRSLS
jgi:four helix bundle protein